jgi:hypothetical protein
MRRVTLSWPAQAHQPGASPSSGSGPSSGPSLGGEAQARYFHYSCKGNETHTSINDLRSEAQTCCCTFPSIVLAGGQQMEGTDGEQCESQHSLILASSLVCWVVHITVHHLEARQLPPASELLQSCSLSRLAPYMIGTSHDPCLSS